MTYRERLWPAPWLFIGTALVIPASMLVFLPINRAVGVVVAVVLYLGVVGLLLLGSPVIAVEGSELRAGRARIPVSLTGRLEAFTGTDATLERGQRLDARAWLLIRGWVGPVAKISIIDGADPTPYWLVSTRRPEELIAAIAGARAGLV